MPKACIPMPNPFFGIADHIWTALTMDTVMSKHLMCKKHKDKVNPTFSNAAVILYNVHCLRHAQDLEKNIFAELWLQAEESAVSLKINLCAILSARLPEFRNYLPDAFNYIRENCPEYVARLPMRWNISI